MNDKFDIKNIEATEISAQDCANEEMILVELEERLEFTQASNGRCNDNGSNNHVIVV